MTPVSLPIYSSTSEETTSPSSDVISSALTSSAKAIEEARQRLLVDEGGAACPAVSRKRKFSNLTTVELSPFRWDMELSEKESRMRAFLTDLRSKGLLLKRSEFKDAQNYMGKAGLGRYLGAKYLKDKADELGLTRIKVPKKIFVTATDEPNLTAWITEDLDIEISKTYLYAEKIKRCKREVTPEELDELIRLCEETEYLDIHWGNFIVAEDGIYIIDTEFKKFGTYMPYSQKVTVNMDILEKIIPMFPEDQRQEVIDAQYAKMEAYYLIAGELNRQRTLRMQQQGYEMREDSSFTFSFDQLNPISFPPK